MAAGPAAVLTDEGLLLPERPPGRLVLVGLMAGALLLLTITVVLVVRAFTDGEWSNLVGAVISLLGTVLFGAATVGVLRRDRTGLLLTPAGLRLPDRSTPLELTWDAVVAVEDSSPLQDDADETDPGWVTFVLRSEPEPGFEDELRLLSGSSYPSVQTGDLVASRDVVRELCRHYAWNPDQRRELTTPAAVERVESMLR